MTIDVNDIRSAITVFSFIAFLAVVWWAYGSRRKSAFERVALSVLDDDGGAPRAAAIRPEQGERQ